MSIEHVIRPKSVAIIGSTDKPGSFGRYACENALASGMAEHVYFVNPTRNELFGRACYPSLSALPEPVDCVEFCTPAHTVNALLEEAGSLGVKGAVVFASGFAEERGERGQAMERELLETCRRHGISLVGPNCVGIANNLDQAFLWGLNLPFERRKRACGAGIVAQSGSLIGGLSSKPDTNVVMALSTGNGGGVTLEDCLAYLAMEPRIHTVMAYMEGVKDGAVLARALEHAAKTRKPVVILKGGRSKKGAASASSHTGNLAGDREMFEALFEKYGVIQANSMDEFICIAQILGVLKGRLPRSANCAAISFSGGECTVMADLCERCGIELPDIAPSTAKAIKEYLPSYAAAKNPLDATTAMFAQNDRFYSVFRAMGQDEAIDSVILSMELAGETNSRHECSMDVLERYAADKDRSASLFIHPFYESTRNPEWRKSLSDWGIPVLGCGESGLNALRKVAEYSAYRPEQRALTQCGRLKGGCKKILSEAQSKERISRAGIAVPPYILASDEEELHAALRTIGFPIALKVDSPDIPHKTEAGGVALNITCEEEALRAYRSILSSCRSRAPGASINGVTVQRMLPEGFELILGVKNDAALGPMLLAGAGGVFTELFRDAALAPCPLYGEEALNMLKRLKSFPLLCGYRGRPALDVEAVCGLMSELSYFAADHAETLVELDLNPVFVYEKGFAIADALIMEQDGDTQNEL